MADFIGTEGGDTFVGTSQADGISGYGGDDTLYGGAGADSINGGAGDDTIYGGAGNDFLTGDLFPDFGEDTIYGGDGDDYINVGSGNDVEAAYGGAGDDNIVFCNEYMDGGSGVDTLFLNSRNFTAGEIVDLAAGERRYGSQSFETLLNFENVDGSFLTESHEEVWGTAGANDIRTGGGNNVLRGYGGNDVLEGGDGNDTLDGGAGVDRAVFDSATAAVTVQLQSYAPTATGGAGFDSLRHVENLTGSDHDDALGGDTQVNDLIGGAGADDIVGRGGDDRLFGGTGHDGLGGGSGDDRLEGGDGDDVLDGATGFDTAVYSRTINGVTVILDGTLQDTGAGSDWLFSIENLVGSTFSDTLTGNADPNRLEGGTGADVLRSREGSDTLLGGSGDDVLEGGAGADAINGGQGVDRASYASAGAGVTVSLGLGGAQNTVGAGTDTLAFVEDIFGSDFADRLTGGAGRNSLYGSLGADILSGAAGDDRLLGGTGKDSLTGGTGVDRFVFQALSETTAAAATADRITDLAAADVVDLSAIDANGAGAGNGTFTRIANEAAFTAAGQMRLTLHGADTWLELNTDADTAAEALILLTGNHTAATAEDGWVL